MKKIVVLALALALSASLAACGGKDASSVASQPSAAAPSQSASSAASAAPSQSAASALTSAVAQAQGSSTVDAIDVPVTIMNKTGADIAELYTTGAGLDSWGDNLIEGATLDDGGSIDLVLTMDAENIAWDIKVADSEGTSIEFFAIDFSECSTEGGTIELAFDGAEGTATLFSK